MISLRPRLLVTILLVSALTGSVLKAQSDPSLDSLLAPQRTAMKALAALDGVWRGPGWTLLPSGDRAAFTQTIRVGPIGEGALKLLEGRTYGPAGRLSATNVEVISFNPATNAYGLRLYSGSSAGDVQITPEAGGFTLQYQDGDATVRLTVAVTRETWSETAERLAPGKAPVRFMELSLKRVGDTDWPAAGRVPPN